MFYLVYEYTMMEFGDTRWTVLVQRVTSLLLQRLTCGTSVPRGSWPMLSSSTGYHGHGTAHTYPTGRFPTHPHIELFLEARGRIHGEFLLWRKYVQTDLWWDVS